MYGGRTSAAVPTRLASTYLPAAMYCTSLPRVLLRRPQHADGGGLVGDPPAPPQILAVAETPELRVKAVGNHDAVAPGHRLHMGRKTSRAHDDGRRHAIAQSLDDPGHQGPD